MSEKMDSAAYQRLRRWRLRPWRLRGKVWVMKKIPKGVEGAILEEEKVAAVMECAKRNKWVK